MPLSHFLFSICTSGVGCVHQIKDWPNHTATIVSQIVLHIIDTQKQQVGKRTPMDTLRMSKLIMAVE